jgi:hypothetical protein
MAPPSPTLLQRSALGLWFLGLGALGLIRWWMRYARDANAVSDAVMQVWLWGSLAIAILGVAWIVHALTTHRRGRSAR